MHVGLNAGQVVSIKGRPASPVQDGALCIEAPMTTQVTFNPARIRTPLRRVAGRKGSGEARCEPASWDEDLDAVADKLRTPSPTAPPGACRGA
jgi:formate dehydrogenase (coenzyme F420) alpha subunit